MGQFLFVIFSGKIQAASKKIYLHKQLHFANQPKN